VADVASVFEGKTIDLDRVRQVKDVQLVICADDTQVHGKGYFEYLALRQSTGLHEAKAPGSSALPPAVMGRRKTLLKIQSELQTIGIHAQLSMVPAAAHESADMLPVVCQFGELLVRKWHN
jgi:hypothetical protein